MVKRKMIKTKVFKKEKGVRTEEPESSIQYPNTHAQQGHHEG